MKKWFVCSDIHSFYDEWMSALKTNGFDPENVDHNLIVCGDLFDRGSQTVQCYEFAKKMIAKDRLLYVKGNHESLLQDLLSEVKIGVEIGRHHLSNGTLDSLAQLMNKSPYDIICGVYDSSEVERIYQQLNDFINSNCKNFYTLGKFIFVHSWLPITKDEQGCFIIDPKWSSDSAQWESARWGNPFDEYLYGTGGIEGRTIVFGHWHTSYAHSTIRKDGTEFGKDANFDIFMDNYIIGLDGCTAFTHKVNCLVIEEGDDGLFNIRQGNFN